MAFSSPSPRKPAGILLVERLTNSAITAAAYKLLVFILTFFAFASYHAARKATSIVKSVLDPKHPESTSGWPPFDSPDGALLLGEIDVAFLASYSLGMYFMGHLGDRLDLRKFLTVGMLGTGLFTALFGAGYWMNVHSFGYYLTVQMIAGLFQSTGWPSVVAVLGNWFGKGNRGLVMGLWFANSSVGNMSGSVIASALLKYGWGWSFAVPGTVVTAMGLVVLMFLPASPSDVGVDGDWDGDEVVSLIEKEERAVGFMKACTIPGVGPFALCLFFSKLVLYSFLYWLPFYLSHTEIDGRYLSSSEAGTLSILFDIGGILGGALVGHISDRLRSRAFVTASFSYTTIPALLLYRTYGSSSLYLNMALMFLVGIFAPGPCTLITTAVSADLGTHGSLKKNARAMATVTAIIDGTGSMGAAIGPLLTGLISSSSWDIVFYMLMVSAFLAGLALTGLVASEARKLQIFRTRQ